MYGPPVTGASVQIYDDHDHYYQLDYTDRGWYETQEKNLKGIVGNSYILHVSTDDGMEYESTTVLMQDVPAIDSVYFMEDSVVNFNKPGSPQEDRLGIFIDTKDITGKTKFWKWEFEETWEVRLRKESVTVEFTGEPKFKINMNVDLAEGVERTCFVHSPSKSVLVESTRENPEDIIRKFRLTSIAPKDDRLYIKYSILVRQYAISKDMFNYWKALRDANENTGSMYDHIPSQIYGNIGCCNSESNALGYFSASKVTTRRIFIYPYQVKIQSQSAWEDCEYYNYISFWSKELYLRNSSYYKRYDGSVSSTSKQYSIQAV